MGQEKRRFLGLLLSIFDIPLSTWGVGFAFQNWRERAGVPLVERRVGGEERREGDMVLHVLSGVKGKWKNLA